VGALPEPLLSVLQTGWENTNQLKIQKEGRQAQNPVSAGHEIKIHQQTDQTAVKTVHLTLNPFILKAEIERKLKRIFQLVKVSSYVKQRIYPFSYFFQ
jgi:hypothetical protein